MKKWHGIWIGIFTGVFCTFTNDLGYIVIALPLAIYIVLKGIDIYREENSKFLYRR